MHNGPPPHTRLGPPPKQESYVVPSQACHRSGPHLRKRGFKLSLPRPDLFRQETLHLHHRAWKSAFTGTSTATSKSKKYRRILPTHCGPQQLLGTGGAHHLPHWPRGHHTDHDARTHDFALFKSLLDSLTDLPQSRLIGIIRKKKRIVEDLPYELVTAKHTWPHPQRTHMPPNIKGQSHTRTRRARHAPRRAPPSHIDGGAG